MKHQPDPERGSHEDRGQPSSEDDGVPTVSGGSLGSFLNRVSVFGAAGAIIIAIVGLLAYVPGLGLLGSVRQGYIPMAPSTAVSFLVLGCILLAMNLRSLPGTSLVILGALAVLVSLFGSLEVVGHFTGRDLNFEGVLVPSGGHLGEIPIARMSPATGAAFLLAGLAMLLLILRQSRPHGRGNRLGHWAGSLGSLVLGISLLFCLAYLLGSPLLYGQGATVPMALTTALAFLMLGAAAVGASGEDAVPVSLLAGAKRMREHMSTRRRFLLLTLIMGAACAMVMAAMTVVLYRNEIREARELLQVTAKSQARLMEAIARYDARLIGTLNEDPDQSAFDATLNQIVDAHERFKGFGESGEFTLARRDGDAIVFLLRHQYGAVERPVSVPFDSDLAEPMRLALEGRSGTVVGLDYRGETVVAAYEPVAELNLGIVAKIDLSEVRAPFVTAGLAAVAVAILVILGGMALFIWIGNPIIDQLEAQAEDLKSEVLQRRESEGKLQAFMESATEGFVVYDSDLNLTSINKTALEIFPAGNTEENLRGKHMLEIVPNLKETGRYDKYVEVLRTGEPVHFNDVVPDSRFGDRHLSVHAFNMGAGLGMIFSDITERRRTEQKIEQQQYYLEKTQELGRLGTWQLDLRRNTLFWTDETCRIFGVPPGSAVDYEVFLEKVHPNDREYVDREWKTAIEGKPYDIEHRMLINNVTTWVREKADVEFDEDGVAVSAIGFAQDITDRKRSEEELEKYRLHLENLVAERTLQLDDRISEAEELNSAMMNILEDLRASNEELEVAGRDLRASNQELDAFSYTISHDLRAPLRHIDGFIKLLLKREKERMDPTSSHYMDTIAESSKRMGQLIDDLLAFSRLGRSEIHFQRVDSNEVIREVRDELSYLTEGRRVMWEVGDLPAVDADRGLLRQVWENLIGNAIKYTGSREEARIEIGATREGVEEGSGEIAFFVRDNGVGFDPQYAHKLFGVFQRLHRNDEFEGTGIGLATVRRIVHRHGGRVWAEGRVDHGATFYFTLKEARGTE